MKNTIIFYASLLILTACGNTLAQTDSAIQSDIIIDSGNIDTTDTTPAATQTLVIDVETLKAPKGPLTTTSYETALRNILSLFDKEGSIIVAHTRQTRPVVESGNPFFCTLYRAYADHRPIELSPEALWLLICQGFSLHVDNNAESLRSMFVDFEGKRTLTVQALLDINNPNTPWEKYFPQFTSQIATYTGQELINALTADFTTSTPASRTASQITVMESMKHYFDYEMTICGIPQVILHGTPEDWQSIVDRVQVLRKYKLDWWVDEMLPILKKIQRASEGDVDKAFWRDMFKQHDLKHEMCGDPQTLADGWIVKFYPYNCMKHRNNLKGLYDGASQLPPEIASVPLKIKDMNDTTINLTLWAGFVGIAQDATTLALRPEIGWFITRDKEQE